MANWFRSMLQRRPLLTNTCVYATFYSAAELSQQAYNKFYTPEKPDVNYAGAARVVATGTSVYAPTLYFWYRYLDRVLSGTTMKTVAKKVCIDQFFMTPILLAAFYTVSSILEGREDVFQELREKYYKSFVVNQMFWIPGQTVNFAFVPPHMRVVYVATVSFMWINVLCFIKRQPAEQPKK